MCLVLQVIQPGLGFDMVILFVDDDFYFRITRKFGKVDRLSREAVRAPPFFFLQL